MRFAELLFAGCFLTIVAICMLAVAYFIATGVVMVIRIFVPHFCEYRRPEDSISKHDRESVKRVAIDFVIAERIRQANALRKRLQELTEPRGIIVAPPKPNITANEFSMEDISRLTQKSTTKENPFKEYPEYHLCQFPNGPQGCARFLIVRRIERGHTPRYAFAALPTKSSRFDFVSAQRLSALIKDTFVVPANAAARLALKKQNGEEAHA